MENKIITVQVMIDAKIFRRFAIFDYMIRQRRWILPLLFAAIMSAFACVCFAARGSKPQAVMIGMVLLVIGLGLPALHIWALLNSIRSQIKAYQLDKPKPVYSLCFSDEADGVQITNPGGESVKYEWEKLYMVYRTSGYIYLYIIKSKAFILPDNQVEAGANTLWAFFADKLPAEKLRDRRK